MKTPLHNGYYVNFNQKAYSAATLLHSFDFLRSKKIFQFFKQFAPSESAKSTMQPSTTQEYNLVAQKSSAFQKVLIW
jgi:hypothetical protein